MCILSVDESLIPTIVGQSKHWPSNFNPRDIQPTLSSLALKLKSNVAPTILLLARIASDHTWCQEFLENILQELESLLLVSDSSICPLLTDLLRDESSAPLWQACCSANLIEQQTAVRLLLLAGTHSPLIYHQTVAQLMTRCYATDRNGLGALVRFVAVPLGAADALQVGPAIELALDELFVHTKPRWGADDDDTEVDLHVLTNLRTLIRLEQQRGADHSDVSRTAVNCVDKVARGFKIFCVFPSFNIPIYFGDRSWTYGPVICSKKCVTSNRLMCVEFTNPKSAFRAM